MKNFRVEPPNGGIGSAAGRRPIGPRVIVVALLRSSVFVYYSDMRQQVPKPTAEVEYEGELTAPNANGDRAVRLAA